jgi:hypothetical protein
MSFHNNKFKDNFTQNEENGNETDLGQVKRTAHLNKRLIFLLD